MTRLMLFVLLAPLCAMAQPKPGQVVQGTAAFPTTGNSLAITNTPNSITNWSSFSVSKDAAPNYIQSPSSAPQLNRVPQSGMPLPITGTLMTAPTMLTMPTVPVHIQPPAAAPASASQAVQLPDGRIVFRATPQ